MKKILTDNLNGFPLYLDDAAFLQEANKELIAKLGGAWRSAYIINGVVLGLGGGNATVTEGFVFFNGEIYKVPAQSVAVGSAGDSIYLTPGTLVIAGGARFDEAANAIDPYEESVLTLGMGSSVPSGSVELLTDFLGTDMEQTLPALDRANLIPYKVGRVVSDTSGAYAVANVNTQWFCNYWLRPGAIVINIRMLGTLTSTGSNALLFKLPLGLQAAAWADAVMHFRSFGNDSNYSADGGLAAFIEPGTDLINMSPFLDGPSGYFKTGSNEIHVFGQITIPI